MTTGWPGAAGVWAKQQHLQGPQDRLLDYGPGEAADAVAELRALQDLSGTTGLQRAEVVPPPTPGARLS